MAVNEAAPSEGIKPGKTGLIAIYLAFFAVVVRTSSIQISRAMLLQYLVLELVFLLLFTWLIWQLSAPALLRHAYFGLQSVLILWMFSMRPQFDFVVVLFILLAYQVALVFSGATRRIWIGILIALTLGSLVYYQGLWHGLALSMTNIAAEIVIPAYIIVSHELENSRVRSQGLLAELQEKHQALRKYTQQVEELTALQERNRLARELHDTVSQLIFSISLTTRSAQILLEKDPQRVRVQLKELQGMTGEALGQLRSFISQLRPPAEQ